MLRLTTILALLLLLTGAPLYAAEPTAEPGDAVEHSSETPAPELDLAALLGGHEGIPTLGPPPFEGDFTAAQRDVSEQGFGCYTGCYPPLDSLCGAGQVAEVTASGPIQDCAIAGYRCVAQCSGPVLQCSALARC